MKPLQRCGVLLVPLLCWGCVSAQRASVVTIDAGDIAKIAEKVVDKWDKADNAKLIGGVARPDELWILFSTVAVIGHRYTRSYKNIKAAGQGDKKDVDSKES